eukprot:COSAG03_NODE_3795_length_1825_cov_1.909618_1_plen_160_part_00
MPVYPSLPTLKFVLKLRPLVCVYGAGILAGLRALREAGRIDEVSLGMNMVVAPQILRLLREAPEGTFDNIMLAHGWNLLCQDGLEVVQECTARGMNRASRRSLPSESGVSRSCGLTQYTQTVRTRCRCRDPDPQRRCFLLRSAGRGRHVFLWQSGAGDH